MKKQKVKWVKSEDEACYAVSELDTSNVIKNAIMSVIKYFNSNKVNFGFNSDEKIFFIKVNKKDLELDEDEKDLINKFEEELNDDKGFKLFGLEIKLTATKTFKLFSIKY